MGAVIAVIVIVVVVVGLILASTGLRVIKQYEKGLVFRFGRVLPEIREPGLRLLVPVADRMQKVNMQVVTMPIPGQAGITRDNVTVSVDAVLYFQVTDPRAAIINVEHYPSAISQVAQTSLRSMIGKSDLDHLLANREELNQGLELLLDSPAVGWGIHIDRVEVKEVSLPDQMERSIARQAEAERERRSKVISAEGELQASEKLSQAAAAMADTPSALQLRLLETIVNVSSEQNSTLVLPFPVELLRFFERAAGGAPAKEPASGAAAGTGTEFSGEGSGAADGTGLGELLPEGLRAGADGAAAESASPEDQESEAPPASQGEGGAETQSAADAGY
jgi:regulator of protease activity HflC (stomatin/prohibitin superfamily)